LRPDGENAISVPFWDRETQEDNVGTALVPIAPVVQRTTPRRSGSPPRADFVAHLIATSAQAPQTRTRRRAEPAMATAAYGALGQWPTPMPSGRTLSRSL
jgi:hypothetical protein